ncbi:MAG: hypothetical protein R3B13_26780 [Polyangiaceae bacterium]
MRIRTVHALSLFVVLAACETTPPAQSPPPPPPPEPAPAPGPTPTPGPGTETGPGPGPASGECTGPAPGPGYQCVQNCGPPVARADDPPPGSSWLSAEDAAKRKQYGCPICLPANVRIDTPRGSVAVSALRVGDAIWTLDARGQRVAGRVEHADSTPISGPHSVVRVRLADGRTVVGSPLHPTAEGRALSDLRAGDALSGSAVLETTRQAFQGDRTYDVLPSGSTGAYWADGVLLRSSFWQRKP